MSTFIGSTGTTAFGSGEPNGERAGVPSANPEPLSQGADAGLASSGSHDNPPKDVPDTRATSLTEVARDGSPKKSKEHGHEASSGEEFDGKEGADIELERRHSLVGDLARQYTSQDGLGEGHNVFLGSDDENSPLNPNGKKFKARAWAKAVVNLISSEGQAFRTSGIAFQHMNVFGFGAATDYQKDVANIWLEGAGVVRKLLGYGQRRIDILRNFDGIVNPGEMLVVLGPPGSGCSTFLKTLAGETSGLNIDPQTYLNYQGITAKEMHKNHRGEAIYTAEVDVHFPMMTVGDTLTFASQARAPRHIPQGVKKAQFSRHLRDVVMAMFGISHTVDTRVGNEYVRGVSGGERKRVTIAEAALSGAPLQFWDNSTRGLDSANAIEFCRTLRLQSEMFNTACCVSIYQAPGSAYELFDKACVLYEGRQIYFGNAHTARQYFIDLGFEFPARATTPDFLTSMTSPQERYAREGFEDKVPRTPDEFAAAWKNSPQYKALQEDIEAYKTAHPIDGPDAQAFRASKRAQQAKIQRLASPFTLSYMQQVKLCLWRGWRRLVGDPSITVGSLIGNVVQGLIVGSVFYNLQPVTSSFYQRGALLFFAALMLAFSSALEILTLFAQRPIVEKHDRYALYHPSAEAIASYIMDLPYKVGNTLVYSLVLYFMTNLRREPGAFFFFLLISFVVVLAMSGLFRTIASATRSLSEAMVPAAIIILALVVFTGFVIPINYMLSWSRWINYIDPVAYAFEAMMVNEFSGRQFTCDQFVPNPQIPGYADVGNLNRVCSTVGSRTGSPFVDGDDYINSSFQYYAKNKWRNFGILVAFDVGLFFVYMIAAELVRAKKSKGEVLVFRRGHKPAVFKEKQTDAETGGVAVGGIAVAAAKVNSRDPEKHNNSGNESDKERKAMLQEQTSVFHWKDVCYDIKIKSETRRILDHVDGWVKPGTLTALMGVSGAGKTTLLDCLADRTSIGVLTGEMLVDGRLRDASFQRKTGYVQQQDLHLQTTTVREALNFSALLRQPAHVSRAEKIAYVDEVIKLLDMEEYADAVVGVPGEGLNVEQRKRLTIGVELAAKPPLLLFVDEPTSGLDSQTSWAILDLLEKLTKSGQAILCTIHQPSAMLFQRFDQLLFLQKGGQTVYFGEIGNNSKVMTSYFERNGGFPCPPDANPAEWMMEVIGAAPGSETDIDWFKTWRESPEYDEVQSELNSLRLERTHTGGSYITADKSKKALDEFAAGFWTQQWEVTRRVFQQYWRTPTYIYAKAALCTLVALFIGFVFFRAPNSIQGLQNQMFAIFQLLTVFGQLVQQTMPHFVIQRSLYEVRERPSKVYSWKVFMLSQIIVEMPWNILLSVVMFVCWYYPVGLDKNAAFAGQLTERSGLMFLLLMAFLLFTGTFTDFMIAGFDTAEAGGNMANLLFILCLIFCGVLATPQTLPGFWIFMYRVSPFTYLISAMLSTAVANTEVQCAANEYLAFAPLDGQTCAKYMGNYIKAVGGYLQPGTENNTTMCSYCTIGNANTYLASVNVYYEDRWRNFGIFFVYIVFNIFAALGVYWLARVPKKGKGFLGLGKKKEE